MRGLFSDQVDLLDALGLGTPQIKDAVLRDGLPRLWARIRSDGDFVRRRKRSSGPSR